MRLNKIWMGLLLLLTLVVAFLGYKVFNASKIAYVKSSDVIYNYLGMKAAQQKQTTEQTRLKAQADSLKIHFENSIREFNASYTSLAKKEQDNRRELLAIEENALKNFIQNSEQKLKESDEQLTTGVLNQINSFIEEYGKEKGYDLILGTTTSGNILFAKEYMDITDDVLKALNDSYKQEVK
jgi:outer membrane protein